MAFWEVNKMGPIIAHICLSNIENNNVMINTAAIIVQNMSQGTSTRPKLRWRSTLAVISGRLIRFFLKFKSILFPQIIVITSITNTLRNYLA